MGKSVKEAAGQRGGGCGSQVVRAFKGHRGFRHMKHTLHQEANLRARMTLHTPGGKHPSTRTQSSDSDGNLPGLTQQVSCRAEPLLRGFFPPPEKRSPLRFLEDKAEHTFKPELAQRLAEINDHDSVSGRIGSHASGGKILKLPLCLSRNVSLRKNAPKCRGDISSTAHSIEFHELKRGG